MQPPTKDCGAIILSLILFSPLNLPLSLSAEDKDLKLIPEDISLLDASLLWDKSFEVRTGVGYKDNVLLRPMVPQGSAFVASGLDISLIRFPMDGLQFYFFLTADDNRYWHEVDGVDKEQTVIGIAQVQKSLENDWKIGSALNYAYLNEVIDVSTVETFVNGFSTAPVEGHTVGIRPFARNDFNSHYWLQLELPITRQFLKSPLDNYWQYGTRLILGREYGYRSEVTLSYGVFQLSYDTRSQFTAQGQERPGSPLALSQYKMESAWQHYWDEPRHWRTSTKASFDFNADNGSGYFSYLRYEFSTQLTYQMSALEVRGKAAISHYDSPVQRISLPDGPKLQKSILNFDLRIQVRLAAFVKIFAEYQNEQSLSNDPFGRYHANTVSGGFAWQF